MKLSTKTAYFKNDNINTVRLIVMFPSIIEENENYENIEMVNRMINSCSNKYQTDKEFLDKISNTLAYDTFIRSRLQGHQLSYFYNIIVPKDKLVEGYKLEDVIEFAFEDLFNPHASNGTFDQIRFNREKNIYTTHFKKQKENIYQTSVLLFSKFFDPEDKLKLNFENRLKAIEDLNPKDCYEFYLRHIKNVNYKIYVTGNYDEKNYQDVLSKYEDKEQNIDINTNLFEILPFIELPEKEDKFKFKQSAYLFEIQIKDYNPKDEYLFYLTDELLNGRYSNCIFNHLRIKDGLVYDCYEDGLVYRGIYLVHLYLSKKNKEAAEKSLIEAIESLKNKEVIKQTKQKIIDGLELRMLEEQDRDDYFLSRQIDKEFEFKSSEEIIEEYKNITEDELINFINRLVITKKMFVCGDEND